MPNLAALAACACGSVLLLGAIAAVVPQPAACLALARGRAVTLLTLAFIFLGLAAHLARPRLALAPAPFLGFLACATGLRFPHRDGCWLAGWR
jgi:hypothetical protein